MSRVVLFACVLTACAHAESHDHGPPTPEQPATVAGDSDHDQIYFDEDQCPNKRYDPPLKRFEAWAIAKYGRGCPVPDADKDGVPDAKDACPGAKHTPLHTVWDDWRQKRKGFGCVEADADKDGVPDEHDKCPATSAGNFMQVDPKTGCMPATN